MTHERRPSSPIRSLWPLIRDTQGFGTVAVLAALSSVTEGFGIVMLVPILAILADGETGLGGMRDWLPTTSLPALLGIILGLAMIRVLVRMVLAVRRDRLVTELTGDLRRRVQSGLFHAEWRWLVLQRQADHVAVLTAQIGRIGQGMVQICTMITLVLSSCIYLVIALQLSWLTSLVTLFAGGFALLITRRQRQRAMELGQSVGPLLRDFHVAMQEGVASIRMSKILGTERSDLAEFDRSRLALQDLQNTYSAGSSRDQALAQVIQLILIIGVIAFSWAIVDLDIATLLPLLVIFMRVVPTIEGVQKCWQGWLQAAPAVADVEQFIETLDQVAEAQPDPSTAPVILRGELRLDHVTVRFGERSEPALAGVTLAFPARTTTAICGPSGAGKSTMADILMGLIAPDEGQLVVDGVAIDDKRQLLLWRRSVAYVDQDVELRHTSIRQNLLSANPAASEQDIVHALEAASAAFVLGLPGGLDTQVGDNGVRFSGGERQRIALARALIRKPQLLILDEATNALDDDNKAAVWAALERLRGRMTIIVVTHGAAELVHVDRVVVLKAGRVQSVSDPGAADREAAG